MQLTLSLMKVPCETQCHQPCTQAPPSFSMLHKKMRGPGNVSGTNLFNSSQSTKTIQVAWFHLLCHSCHKFYQASSFLISCAIQRNVEKLGGTCGYVYKAITAWLSCHAQYAYMSQYSPSSLTCIYTSWKNSHFTICAYKKYRSCSLYIAI